MVITSILEEFGHQIDTTGNGERALDMINSKFKTNCNCTKNYKLIILDNYMPIKSGIETALEIREC